MRYAEVAVDAPVGHARTFSYSIPPQYSLEPGQMVWIPFGSRVTQGIVVGLADPPQVEVTRDIIAPIEPSPLVDEVHMKLARWLSEYYLCSLFNAVSLMLPPGFEGQVRSQIFSGDTPRDADTLGSMPPQTLHALETLTEADLCLSPLALRTNFWHLLDASRKHHPKVGEWNIAAH